jgi:hypothetical protein
MAGSQYSAAYQAYSRSRVCGSRPAARVPTVPLRSNGDFEQRSIAAAFAFQKIVKFFFGLPSLFSFEPDLIGPAKNSSANSP